MKGNLTGEVLRTQISHQDCKVGDLLGTGTEGEVYKAEIGGQPVAVKWYFSKTATLSRQNALREIINKGQPNNSFLWPVDLVSSPGLNNFGYYMPLRPPHYVDLNALMTRQISPMPTFRTLATTGFHLANNFRQLHAEGLCYYDISFSNVFFDPATGDVLICDNDNVTFDPLAGNRQNVEIKILGTPKFMAPELVQRLAEPSSHTDLYSLAVLLFYLLMHAHPLEGQQEYDINIMDDVAFAELYGSRAVFIFDPDNDCNRPVDGYHVNAQIFWAIYPTFVRDLFTQAFTDGIHNPESGRVREGQWQSAMRQLHDAIFRCTTCNSENFYDGDLLLQTRGVPGTCWRCKSRLILPPRIRLDNQVVMLNDDSYLYPHHVDPQTMYDTSAPVASVKRHPNRPDLVGLCNESDSNWVLLRPGESARQIQPGETVKLIRDTIIQFGKMDGTVRV